MEVTNKLVRSAELLVAPGELEIDIEQENLGIPCTLHNFGLILSLSFLISKLGGHRESVLSQVVDLTKISTRVHCLVHGRCFAIKDNFIEYLLHSEPYLCVSIPFIFTIILVLLFPF